jgi:hypothetical protein
VSEISPMELLGQLRKMVELVAADAADQLSWLLAERVPVDELMLQLDDAVPAWLPRLERAGLIEARAEPALQSLLDFLKSLRWDQALWQDDALDSRREWQQARELARQTLDAFPGR